MNFLYLRLGHSLSYAGRMKLRKKHFRGFTFSAHLWAGGKINGWRDVSKEIFNRSVRARRLLVPLCPAATFSAACCTSTEEDSYPQQVLLSGGEGKKKSNVRPTIIRNIPNQVGRRT